VDDCFHQTLSQEINRFLHEVRDATVQVVPLDEGKNVHTYTQNQRRR
jgi:hypothetical protein